MLQSARWTLARQLLFRDRLLLRDYAYWYLSERMGVIATKESNLLTSIGVRCEVQRIDELVGDWIEGPALTKLKSWIPLESQMDIASTNVVRMAADHTLGKLVYVLVRTFQPKVVVETGVATGITTAHVLAALSDNGTGELHSIDLPPSDMITGNTVGIAVPHELRNRWFYHWGASRRLLPSILKDTHGLMGLFIHDSDHRYNNMRWEMKEAWKELIPGGWLVADDVHLHSAFQDFATSIGVDAKYSAQEMKEGCTGILQKLVAV